MAGTEPGERGNPGAGAKAPLDRPPSDRYANAGSASTGGGSMATPAVRGQLLLPLLKAAVAALLGAAGHFAVAALIASTAGLLFVAGLTGSAVGLLLARAAVPGGAASAAVTRQQVTLLAIGVSIGGVFVGAFATWLNALGEGGTLGFFDYQMTTFGPFVLGEVVLAAIAAAWGASAGPVEG